MLKKEKFKKKLSLFISMVMTIVMTLSGINLRFDNEGIIPKITFGEKTYAATYDPATDISPVSSGWYHNLLLQSGGTVKAWGRNDIGQLGLSDYAQRITPTTIPNLTGVKQLAASNLQSFALMNDGTVKAWGYNGNAQLGLGNTSTYITPTTIPNLTGVKQIVAGSNSTFALMNDGTVKAWGYNGYGQLGIGNTSTYYYPTVIPNLTGVKQLAAGENHTLALMNDGTVKAWGYNYYGQLGVGNSSDYYTPTVVPGLSGVKQLAASYYQSFALINDETVKAWGYNGNGQLGLGNTSTYYSPVAITGLSGVIQITSGYLYTMSLMSDGTVKSWGNNGYGQLGLGNTTQYLSPTLIPGLTGVRRLSAGYDNSIALMKDSSIKVWGNNGNGQLGLGDTGNRVSPTVLSGINYFVKTNVSILNPIQNCFISRTGNNLIPSISVSDNNNDSLTCKLYLDSEASPRDTKTVTNTISSQTISFTVIAAKSLNKGAHSLTFYIYDGTETTVLRTNFTVGDFDPAVRTMPIQAGFYHNLLLQSDGTVKAWGNNNYGQLGFGDTTQRNAPTAIPNLTGVKQLAASNNQSFALMNDGTVKAWGYNGNGQLGIGNTTTYTTPTRIPNLTGVKQIVTASNSTFALLNDGTVKAWGYNGNGQLGIGNTSTTYTPTTIPNLTGVKQIVAGDNHTLALMNDGTVKAWGYNGNGQLGLGNWTEYYTPTVVSSLIGVKQLAASSIQSFALMNDGTVKSWGYNYYGQLGLGNTSTYNSPISITGLSGVIQIVSGNQYTMALMSDGTVKAWGYNGYGQLGTGNTSQYYSPTAIPNLTGVTQLNVGYDNSIAITKDGSVKVWGNNGNGQLGLGDTNTRISPAVLPEITCFGKTSVSILNPTQGFFISKLDNGFIPSISVSDSINDNLTCKLYVDSETTPRDTKSVTNTIASQTISFTAIAPRSLSKGKHLLTFNISDGTETTIVSTNFTVGDFDPTAKSAPIQAGFYHNLLLQSDGTVKAWGRNDYGQLGFGDSTQRNIPTSIPNLTGVKQLASSNLQSFALMNDGTVKAWGYNGNGQLGLGNTSTYTTPTSIPNLTGVKQVVAGTNSTFALMNDGTVKAWGNNGNGQLGIGNSTTTYIPTTISNLTGVKQLVAGDNHTLALLSDGTVKAWGYNEYGQLGLGNSVTYYSPTVVSGLTGVKQLAASYYQSFALMNDGTVKVYGYNGNGQLGLGNTSTYNYSPVTIAGLSGVIQIVAGYQFTMALMSDGTVKTWGYNGVGQLGVGNSSPYYLPTLISGLTGVSQLNAGYDNSIAIMKDGTVKVWGNNGNGQLGLGDTNYRLSPTVLPGINCFGKTNVSILSPIQYSFINKSDNNLIPSISVSDNSNDNLICKVYLDSETTPRDTKSVTNTISSQIVSFVAIAPSSLSKGTHLLTVNISDGTETTVVRNNFTVGDFDPTVKSMPIKAGWYHNLSLQGDGTVKAWGRNDYGQLGFGDTTQRNTPTIISSLTGVKQIAASQYQSFALMSDGTVKAWGYNGNGLLGIGNTSTYTTPTTVPNLTGVKQIVAGSNSTFALMNDGTVKAWGYNGNGQLGIGNTSTTYTPTTIPNLTGVKQLVTGDYHTLALMNDGTVKTWGYNGNGQLGIGNTSTTYTPTIIPNLTGVKQLVALYNQSFALMNDGTVKGWGNNDYGQLGLGYVSTYNYSPVSITGLSGVTQIVAGYLHTMALMSDGTVKSWGYNVGGQLGLGNTSSYYSPTLITGLTGVNQLNAGYDHSIALMNDRTIKIWGNNGNGQLGLNDTTNRLVPTVLPGMRFNSKPAVNISTQTQNYASSKIEDSISPIISVQDFDNDNLTCTYFIDNETNPRDTKVVANSVAVQNITFSSLNLGTLTQGTHTLKFNINDGLEATIVETKITINRTGPNFTVLLNEDRSVTLTFNDNYPTTTLYQIKCDSRYVNSKGEFVSEPEWFLLTTKKITIGGLFPDTSYTLSAKAKNSTNGETVYGNSVTIAPAPTNVKVEPSSESKIRVTWNPVEGAERYIIDCDGIVKDNGVALWYEDTNLQANSTHKYRVRAVINSTPGQWSDHIQADTKRLNPMVPAGIVITATATSTTITWSKVDSAFIYEIETDGVIVSNGAKTTYVHDGLKPSTIHSYRVRAKNLAGYGPWSALKEVMTTDGLPKAPVNITRKASGTTITLNWDIAENAESYEVVEVINGQEVNLASTEKGTTYVRRGLVPGTTHVYKIRGVNSIGAGEWVTLEPITTYMLDMPENLKASSTDTSITLSWDKVKDAQSYDIDVKRKVTTGEIVSVRTITGIAELNCSINLLEPESRYIICIKAKGSSGESSFTEPTTILTLPMKPMVPKNVGAIMTDTTITICWEAVPNVVGYDIELDGVVLENDNTTTYVNNELKNLEVHTYRVRARNSAIEGDWSTLESIRTLPGKPLSPSTIFVKSTQTGATISWDAVDGALSYDLEVFDGTKTEIVENIKDTKFTHRRVVANAECKYRVRTRNVEGISSWSGYIINNAIKVNGSKNKNVDIGLTATDVSDFTPYTMVVTYNQGVLDVSDLSNLTGQIELTPGRIQNTDIVIKEFIAGRIVFVVDKVMSPDEAWTGIINSIKFKAKANGGTTVTYTVQCKVK